jgi:hypothetical protein
MDIKPNKNGGNNNYRRQQPGDDLRYRIKGSAEPDIAEVWQTQKQIRKADKKLEKEYKRARAQAKALKKQMKVNDKLGKNDEITINLSVPKIPKVGKLNLKNLQSKLPSKQTLTSKPALIGGVVLLVFLSGLVLKNTFFDGKKGTEVAGAKVEQKPNFDTLESPNEASKNPAFDEAKGVASFKDTIDKANLVVSMQKLPEAFKGDPSGKLAEFAKANYLNNQVDVGETKVYIGQSIKGPQTTVFIKNGLLVFISSDQTVLNSQWIDYIGSLK